MSALPEFFLELDYNECRNNWCIDLNYLLNLLDLNYYYESKVAVDINLVKFKYTIITQISGVVKFYKFLNYELKTHSKLNLAEKTVLQCKYLRSTLHKFRCWILLLRIETDRYHGEPEEDWLCKLCSNNYVEDEIQFLLHCSLHTNFRSKLFDSNGCNLMPQSPYRDITNHPHRGAKYFIRRFT